MASAADSDTTGACFSWQVDAEATAALYVEDKGDRSANTDQTN